MPWLKTAINITMCSKDLEIKAMLSQSWLSVGSSKGVMNLLPEVCWNNSGTGGKISPSCIQDSPPQLWTYRHSFV